MQKTAAEWEKETLDSLKSKTGKDYNGWVKEIKKSKVEKRNDIIKRLKTEHELNHLQAQTIVGVYLNKGKLVYGNADQLKEAQFIGKEDLIPIYNEIEKAALSVAKDTSVVVKKLYMSFNGKREFAVASIKKNGIRVGMDLGDTPFDNYVERAVSLGAMPRISHMVKVSDKKQVDTKLKSYLNEAYRRVHE